MTDFAAWTDRYLRYDELTDALRALCHQYPDILELRDIGRSYEGRAIWLVVATNRATGPDERKPAILVDGNIHAVEITGSAAALRFAIALARGYRADPTITHVLDTRAVYIVPRISPDGAELALADRPRFVRSSVRPYPSEDPVIDGLIQEDIDGNGLILSMRVPDPDGGWTTLDADPRIMVRRRPGERGRTYYRLFAEGRIEGYDGDTVAYPPRRQNLDLNRNFPADGMLKGDVPHAGPYPLSEPETAALAAFVASHLNIVTWVCGHTPSGVILTPSIDIPEERIHHLDAAYIRLAAARGSEQTGYPALNPWRGFRPPGAIGPSGTADWAFQRFGTFVWAIEYWGIHRAAGLTLPREAIGDWYDDHPEADEVALMRWHDAQPGGGGFHDWRPFNHPQLGPVEIGGWDPLRGIANPPEHLLASEVAPFPAWFVDLASHTPRLTLRRVGAARLGPRLWRVSAVIANEGWLPTDGSLRARAVHAVAGVTLELILSNGAALVQGARRDDLGQLDGHGGGNAFALASMQADRTGNLARRDWIVEAEPATRVAVVARHPRAGWAEGSVTLGDARGDAP